MIFRCAPFYDQITEHDIAISEFTEIWGDVCVSKAVKKNFQTRLDNNSTTFFFSHELRAFSFSLFSSVKNINNMMATTKFSATKDTHGSGERKLNEV